MSRLTEFDRKIMQVVTMLRREKKINQDNIADALNMKQSNYSLIENAEVPYTPGQLKIIAEQIETDMFDIIKMAEALP